MKKVIVSIAAAAVVAMPVTASAVEASIQTSTAPVIEENELEGGSGVIVAILAAAAIIAGIIIAADGSDDTPTSP